MSLIQHNIDTTKEYLVPILDYNQYKIGDHVTTYYLNNRYLAICGIIRNIFISNQGVKSVQILIDGSSELRTYKITELVGRIVRY